MCCVLRKFFVIPIIISLKLELSLSSQNWALLVAGSYGWDQIKKINAYEERINYRHQSDICRAYWILRKNGFPEENIVVMMSNDIVQNSRNPTPGILVNDKYGVDVYRGGTFIDYEGKDVTPENFLNIIRGHEDRMAGIGSEKVIKSGPEDNIILYFDGHGGPGYLEFLDEKLYAADLNNTLWTMFIKEQYKKMLLLVDSCYAGSMFQSLPDFTGIFVMTAADSDEVAQGHNSFDDIGYTSYDIFSINWMRIVEKTAEREKPLLTSDYRSC